MTVEKKYTENQRHAFQTRLQQRAEKLAVKTYGGSKLDWFVSIGYFYATGLNFGKIFKRGRINGGRAKHIGPLIEQPFRHVQSQR